MLINKSTITRKGFKTAITEMIAERINDEIFKETTKFDCNDASNEIFPALHFKYRRYTNFIRLLQQLFVMMDYSEDLLLYRCFQDGIDEVYEKITENNADTQFFMKTLDKIYAFYVERVDNGIFSSQEYELIENYQKCMNSFFTKVDTHYIKFFVLLTSEKLKDECLRYIVE